MFTPELAKDLMTNISKGVFTLRDMYEQFKSIQKLGPMSQVRHRLLTADSPFTLPDCFPVDHEHASRQLELADGE